MEEQIFKVFLWDERRVVVLCSSFKGLTVLDLDAFTAKHCAFSGRELGAEDITFDSLTSEVHFHHVCHATSAFRLQETADDYRLEDYRFVTKLYAIWAGSVAKHTRRWPNGDTLDGDRHRN